MRSVSWDVMRLEDEHTDRFVSKVTFWNPYFTYLLVYLLVLVIMRAAFIPEAIAAQCSLFHFFIPFRGYLR
ncbi:hypothetical protein K438DRAFT_1821787 [Mycena galopus ATCC 62051]|nr:hypothetical protein K438DRAFT_1821787 [Mycena galopus ATCC 62051]